MADQLPSNEEAEKALICTAILYSGDAAAMAELVEPEDFYNPIHAAIWRGIRELTFVDAPIDIVSLADHLEKHESGNRSWLASLAKFAENSDTAPTPARAQYHAGLIREKAFSRRAVIEGTEIARLGYKGCPDEARAKAQALVAALPDPDNGHPSLEGAAFATMPDLPKAAHVSQEALDAAQNMGRWLMDYTDYAVAVSPMTPRHFHEAAGLWLAATAIARRLYVALPHANVYPNLYILWCAPTTLFAKTTGQNAALDLANETIWHLLLPQENTPEALLAELTGKEPSNLNDIPGMADRWIERRNFAAQRGLIYDELTQLLTSARKDYNAGLSELLLRLHDCPANWMKRTQGGGLAEVRCAYLSILAATTPAGLRPYLGASDWLSGFWPRWAILYPQTERPKFKRTDQRPQRPANLTERLSKLASHDLPKPQWPNPPEARACELSPEARAGWEKYDQACCYDLLNESLDERLWGSYGRLPTQAIKVSLLLAALDWNGDGVPMITLGHWTRAQTIVESWRAAIHNLLAALAIGGDERLEDRIVTRLGEAGGEGATIRDLYRMLGENREMVERAVANLERDGLIARQKHGTQGRPKMAYHLARFVPA